MEISKVRREHDFDGAWKSILEAFEKEIVELLFPEIYEKIAWDLGTESLDNELRDIQKDMFDKFSNEKVISYIIHLKCYKKSIQNYSTPCSFSSNFEED